MPRRSSPSSSDHPEGSVSFSTEEVCLNELEAAVSVYARQYNFIAAHLLASAAHDVMRGFGKRENKPLRADHLKLLKSVLGSDGKAAVDALLLGYNSIKHSNASEVAVTIHPDLAAVTLSQACQEFGWLFGYLTPYMAGYVMWVHLALPPLRKLAPSNTFALFPSALKDGERFDQLAELRAMLDGIDSDPDHYAGFRESLRITGVND